ncbi:MAG: ABC transporter substrate-binding protein [Spirochaetia bacterium]
MSVRQLAITVVVLFAAAGLVFAGGQQEAEEAEASQEEAEEEQQTVELNFFQFKPYLDEAYGDLVEEFREENPNVEINVQTYGGGQQWQDILRGRFASGAGPEIFPVEGPAQYEQWSEYIADLSGEPWIDTAVPFALEALNVDGKQMGMPVNLEGYGYIYNKEIFEEAGISERPTTLSELTEAAEQLDEAGYTPFGTGYATWWVTGLHLMNVAFAHQDDPLAFIEGLNDGSESFSDNELFADLQDLVDLTVEYGEEDPLTTDHEEQVQMFANGEVAMIQQGVWKEVPIMEVDEDIEIGLLPPALNDSAGMDRIPVGVPFYFVVNKEASEQKQEAAKSFLNFMVNTDVGQRYATEEFGFIPAYQDVEPRGLGGVGKDILEYAGEDKTVPWVFGRFPEGFADDASDAIQQYVTDRISWSEVLEQLDQSWERRAE